MHENCYGGVFELSSLFLFIYLLIYLFIYLIFIVFIGFGWSPH